MEEAVEDISCRKAQGFIPIQTQLAMAPEQMDRTGRLASDGDMDFARPDERYHKQAGRTGLAGTFPRHS